MTRTEVVEAWRQQKWAREQVKLAIIRESDKDDLEFTLWHLGYTPLPLQMSRIEAEADAGIEHMDVIVKRTLG